MGYVEGNNAMFADWKKLTGRVPGKMGYDTAAIEIDHANTVFIRDGVVCPELWFAQRTRPLFLLKEAYNGDGDWDLASDHLLTSNSASRMWRRVSHWTYALLNTTAEELVPYDPGLDVSKYGNDYLRRIAVVNVKRAAARTTQIWTRYAATPGSMQSGCGNSFLSAIRPSSSVATPARRWTSSQSA